MRGKTQAIPFSQNAARLRSLYQVESTRARRMTVLRLRLAWRHTFGFLLKLCPA